MYDDFEAPPRRMQPGTKAALGFFGFALGVGLIMGIVALAHRAGAPERERKSPPSSTVSPRTSTPEREPSAASDPGNGISAAIVGGSVLVWLLFFATAFILIVLTQILILIWVVRDARARGADGGVWLIVILLSHVIGLLVYVASRPPGLLVRCSCCGNKRLDYLRACPTCQHTN